MPLSTWVCFLCIDWDHIVTNVSISSSQIVPYYPLYAVFRSSSAHPFMIFPPLLACQSHVTTHGGRALIVVSGGYALGFFFHERNFKSSATDRLHVYFIVLFDVNLVTASGKLFIFLNSLYLI